MGKHSLLMMAGCGVMLLGVFILPMLGIKLGGILPVIVALACPVSMVLMMGSMGRGDDPSGRTSPGQQNDHRAPCRDETAARALPAPSNRE